MNGKRMKLAGNKRHNKEINMEWVYTELDKGRTVKSVAQELQVSESTLRRRHKEYQESKNSDDEELIKLIDFDQPF